MEGSERGRVRPAPPGQRMPGPARGAGRGADTGGERLETGDSSRGPRLV